MKESMIIEQECEKSLKELYKCLKENGYKGRYLGWCSNLSIKFSTCRKKLYVQQRLEHNRETLGQRRQVYLEKLKKTEKS